MECISITIDKKREEFQKNLFEKSKLRIPKYFFGCHFEDVSGHVNCTLSHVNIIRMAKFLNWDSVLIFEDDAYPCINCKTKLESAIRNAPKNAYILVIGWNKNFNSDYSKEWNKTKEKIWGSHAYIIFNEGYDEALRYFSSSLNNHADWQYCSIKNSYYYKEPLFIQYNFEPSAIGKFNGYILNHVAHKNPPKGFDKIENILKC